MCTKNLLQKIKLPYRILDKELEDMLDILEFCDYHNSLYPFETSKGLDNYVTYSRYIARRKISQLVSS